VFSLQAINVMGRRNNAQADLKGRTLPTTSRLD